VTMGLGLVQGCRIAKAARGVGAVVVGHLWEPTLVQVTDCFGIGGCDSTLRPHGRRQAVRVADTLPWDDTGCAIEIAWHRWRECP
jgi:hypothetical protein